jgi:pyridoxal phosphate enzyme (YggS family)
LGTTISAMQPSLATLIATNVALVRAEMAAACARVGRDASEVTLIAVTKSQGPEVLPALVAAGVRDFGENRVDHLALMRSSPACAALTETVRFHAIGRVQGRQFAELVPLAHTLHSLAELSHVSRLAKAAAQRATPFPVLLQVNTSGEAAKAGLPPEAIGDLLATVRAEPALNTVGLMTMAPEGASETELRRTFRRLRELADHHGLPERSMGMSQDFAIAIEEGATCVRVGTRLFTALA